MKSLIAVLVILFIILQYNLWFDPSGILATIKLHEKLDQEVMQNAKLAESNQMISHEIEDLKKGEESVEEHARNDLGMVKKGETYYHYYD